MDYAILLAGGVGSRFWPLSRKKTPKQFLKIFSKKTLLEETIERVRCVVATSRICIATSNEYKTQIKDIAKRYGILTENILFEPVGRNTLAPLGYFASFISLKDPQACFVALPCDHYIGNQKKFISYLKASLVSARNNFIVTLGICPTRPETGYGYIKSGLKIKSGVFEIRSFVEKPNAQTAQKFLKSKNYYWNAGVFAFKADVLLKEIQKFHPTMIKGLSLLAEKGVSDSVWKTLASVSIDYGIMEKTRLAVLIPAEYGWHDVGSWEALSLVHKPDACGRIQKGECLDINSRDTIVWADKTFVATVGLRDVVVIASPDAVLVCNRKNSQDVKQVVQMLKTRKKELV